MAAGGSIDPEKRKAIVAELHKTGASVAAIARQFGMSTTTIRLMKANLGLTGPESIKKTQNAAEERRAQLALQRREISALFLARSREALVAMNESAIIYNFGGKDNTYNEKEVDKPPTGDQRNLMIIAATALDKHLVAERFDQDSASGPIRGLLEAMAEQLTKGFGPPPTKLDTAQPPTEPESESVGDD